MGGEQAQILKEVSSLNDEAFKEDLPLEDTGMWEPMMTSIFHRDKKESDEQEKSDEDEGLISAERIMEDMNNEEEKLRQAVAMIDAHLGKLEDEMDTRDLNILTY